MHVGVPFVAAAVYCQFEQHCQPEICSENTMSILCMLQVRKNNVVLTTPHTSLACIGLTSTSCCEMLAACTASAVQAALLYRRVHDTSMVFVLTVQPSTSDPSWKVTAIFVHLFFEKTSNVLRKDGLGKQSSSRSHQTSLLWQEPRTLNAL